MRRGRRERDGPHVAVDPDDAVLARFQDEDPGGPVVMLNLLRFGAGGYAAYQKYARHLRETFLPKYGAKVLYAGSASTVLVGEADQVWDAVVVVRYPDRATFGRMVADPGYLAVAELRSQALSETVLQATTPWR